VGPVTTTTTAAGATAERVETRTTMLVAGLIAFAVIELALTLFMAAAPHAFFTAVGPFGGSNDHYVRDVATYNAALTVGLLVAVREPSWRVPVLAMATVQFAAHSVNHLIDIASAHPGWVGYLDFFALAFGTLQLALLLWLALSLSREPTRPWEVQSK
jgi:hypothetical protein